LFKTKNLGQAQREAVRRYESNWKKNYGFRLNLASIHSR